MLTPHEAARQRIVALALMIATISVHLMVSDIIMSSPTRLGEDS